MCIRDRRKGTQAVLDLATAEISNSRKILQEKFPGSAVEDARHILKILSIFVLSLIHI